jgi:hypothetical protein
MTGGDNDGQVPSLDEVAEREAASRRRIIEDGGPQRRPPDGRSSGKDRPTGIVSEDEETGRTDPLKGT